MGWFNKHKDFGEYLPDDEAELKEENITISANNRAEAEKKCKEEADEYDGFDSKTKPIGEKTFNCNFKFWG